eukprot:3352499-Pleurochrysis_carterae.AAC.2
MQTFVTCSPEFNCDHCLQVHDEFVMKLVSAVTDLKVGRGTEEGVAQGPLISEAAVRKVEEHVADAVAKGAEILAGGSRHKLGGTFFQPTIIAGATKHMKVTEEETFGPLAPIYRFENEEEVLHAASDTPFGLAAYFYSRDLARVWRVSEALEYGMVGVNTGVISSEVAPFGGMKESGHGREGSKYGIDEYMNVKYVAHAVAPRHPFVVWIKASNLPAIMLLAATPYEDTGLASRQSISCLMNRRLISRELAESFYGSFGKSPSTLSDYPPPIQNRTAAVLASCCSGQRKYAEAFDHPSVVPSNMLGPSRPYYPTFISNFFHVNSCNGGEFQNSSRLDAAARQPRGPPQRPPDLMASSSHDASRPEFTARLSTTIGAGRR